jgi:hypothetical protein
MSNLRSCDPLAYSDNERAKQLLYGLDDHVWGMKIIGLEDSADFATLDTEKLFSKLKSHECFRKGRPNHDASLTSKVLITSAHVGGHDANPTKTVSFAWEFALSSLAAASNEQFESIPDDEIALVARKFRALHKFRKERRRSHRATSSVVTPPTSSPTAPRGRSSPPPTSTTTPTGMTTTTKVTTRRRTASETRRRKEISEDHVLSMCYLE